MDNQKHRLPDPLELLIQHEFANMFTLRHVEIKDTEFSIDDKYLQYGMIRKDELVVAMAVALPLREVQDTLEPVILYRCRTMRHYYRSDDDTREIIHNEMVNACRYLEKQFRAALVKAEYVIDGKPIPLDVHRYTMITALNVDWKQIVWKENPDAD